MSNYPVLDQKDTRSGFGAGLHELGKKNPNVVALCADLPEPGPSHSRGHRDTVARFGRFPHRNPLLGRKMTDEEAAWLATGGFAG